MLNNFRKNRTMEVKRMYQLERINRNPKGTKTRATGLFSRRTYSPWKRTEEATLVQKPAPRKTKVPLVNECLSSMLWLLPRQVMHPTLQHIIHPPKEGINLFHYHQRTITMKVLLLRIYLKEYIALADRVQEAMEEESLWLIQEL